MLKKNRRKTDVASEELDLTSMIDVCFLLIAFFIMVTEVSKSEVVEIFLPIASFSEIDKQPPDNRIIVNIDRKGEVWIRGENYGMPNLIDSKRDLELELKAHAKRVGYEDSLPGNPSKLTVMLRADAHVANRYVQCVQILLTQAKVMKLHYQTKNPERVL